MHWDQRLGALFDDLEQQAEGLALAQRDAEVAELSRAEYAAVDLDARLHASVGRTVALTVRGGARVEGVVLRVGAGWVLLAVGGAEALLRLAAVTGLRGLAERSVPPRARSVGARLGLASALRGVAEAREPVALQREDGSVVHGHLGRVGADFVEVADPATGYAETVPFSALVAVRS